MFGSHLLMTQLSQISTESQYRITSAEEGKKIRASISYTDGQNFFESVATSSITVQSTDDGDATFTINRKKLAGETLNIIETTADPMEPERFHMLGSHLMGLHGLK